MNMQTSGNPDIQDNPGVLPGEGMGQPEAEQTAEERLRGQILAAFSDEPAGEVAPGEAAAKAEGADSESEAGDAPKPDQPQPEPPQKHKVKFATGERELTMEELTALAQQGDDYTWKTQQLVAKAKELEQSKALEQFILSDPDLRQIVSARLQGVPPQAPPPAQQQNAQMDPLEQFRQEVKADLLRELAPALAPVQVIQRQQAGQSFLGGLRQRDPDNFDGVYADMQAFVANQPQSVRGVLHQQLDNDPEAFFGLYTDVRAARLANGGKSLFGQAQPGQQPPAQGAQAPASDAQARIDQMRQERREVPPHQTAGATDVKTDARAKELAAINARLKAGKAREDDLLRHMQMQM